ncbi:RagB/SusD family nutrient uptake outer membrane protein [Chitinophaga sp.]|uniref:RagB/SusD family nutrient uptake outer membrane protein n=1 Tax=Chitinophaga sp. TaxID=1869181 RepID=UPI002F93A7A9
MKRTTATIRLVAMLTGFSLFAGSCTKNLLDQQPTVDLGTASFWKTEGDATIALMGAYADIRPLFDRDYYFDGQGEYSKTRNASNSTVENNLQKGGAYFKAGYDPSGYANKFDNYFKYAYGGVSRANYVIENVTKMLPNAISTSIPNLEAVIGEARLLRGMVYFRLISMWGDVPYIGHVINDNSEVTSLSRMPIAQIKDSILADFTYAFEKLPVKATQQGRVGKPAALAFRGKLQLFWACWNKFGWPELSTFTPDAGAATAAYTAAAADFKAVINNYGLTLYMNGEPGECDELGKADKLPNYYDLFTSKANGNPEMIMAFNHGGIGTGQGEELLRDFAGRSLESGQCWVSPRFEVADRYQSTITGDFAPKLIPMNPATQPTARTAPNSALNPQSYANRDYRMKASILWDYEVLAGMASLKPTGWIPFIYKSWGSQVKIDGVNYIAYNTDGCKSGYVYRKFVRNKAGLGRSDGDYAYPVMRLADVYLMYAEASNEASGPQGDAIDVVNRVRHRGNLPPLNADKTATKADFFNAIEQERIVELLAEGQRGFDLRRWRAIERVWGPPNGPGVSVRDTQGLEVVPYFQNASQRTYQQCYIFKIPQEERDRNPNLTQNTPWL